MTANILSDLKKIIFGENGRKFTSYPEDIASVLLVTRGIIKNKKNEYLMVQRSPKDRFETSLWEFPGGKVDRGETDIKDSLRNEITQETNLEVEILNSEPYIISKGTTAKDKFYQGFIIITAAFKCTPTTINVKISHEHNNYKWVNKDEITKIDDITKITKELLNTDFFKSF